MMGAVHRWLVPVLVAGAVAARAESLVDPTRPADWVAPPPAGADTSEPSVVSWRVTMIRMADAGALAIVNGKVVRAGDKVADATVLRIGPRAVELERGGEHFEVALALHDVKRAGAQRTGTRQGGNL